MGFRVQGLGVRFQMRPDLHDEEMLECLEPLGFKMVQVSVQGSGCRI